jgi:hypothetical protein
MPDRFATGASAIRPTPDAHLSWFHWDRLASSGWEADIRSSRLKDASAPRRDIRRLPLVAANRGRKRSCPHRDRTRPEASENW